MGIEMSPKQRFFFDDMHGLKSFKIRMQADRQECSTFLILK